MNHSDFIYDNNEIILYQNNEDIVEIIYFGFIISLFSYITGTIMYNVL